MRTIFLQRLPNGNLADWGRDVTVGGVRGEGPARVYFGEDAKILRLVLEHTERNRKKSKKACAQ
jgi:hypothetical protein